MSTNTTVSNVARDDRKLLAALVAAAAEARRAARNAERQARFRAVLDEATGDAHAEVEAMTCGLDTLHGDPVASLDVPELDGWDTGHVELPGGNSIRRSAPPRSVEVVWADRDLLRGAIRQLDCDVQPGRERLAVTYREQPILDVRFEEGGRARVRILRGTGAALLERINQLYLQRAFERHAEANGCKVEQRRDGSLVVRPSDGSRKQDSTNPAASPGTLEVDFAGFSGQSCQRVLGAISKATGVRVVRNAVKNDERRQQQHLHQGAKGR